MDEHFSPDRTEPSDDKPMSPIERLLMENAELLAILSEQVGALKNRVVPISSRTADIESAKAAAYDKTEPGPIARAHASSKVGEKLQQEQMQIKKVTRGIREVLEMLEV